MIDKKLHHLSEYIDMISQKDPLDLFSTYISTIEKTDIADRPRSKKIKKELFTSLDNLYKHTNESNMNYDEFLSMVYEYLIQNMRKHMIYQKALDLGIDSTLFKKEMGFLFKGKPLE